MLEFLFVSMIGLLAFLGGYESAVDAHQSACIAKYSDMPHNKVTEYCTTLLKFEKEVSSDK